MASTLANLESLTEEIKCYSLPYGALGFVSHVLTYYTIVCLWFGRKPFWPFSRVSYSRFDLALGGFGLLISTLLSIITIIRCKNTWELLVIAVWKLSMSLLNGITAIHVACLFILEKIRLKRRRKESRASASDDAQLAQRKEADGRADEAGPGAETKEANEMVTGKPQETPIQTAMNPLRKVAWWIVPYIPGMFAGIAGLMSLVAKNKKNAAVLKLTAGFYVIVGAGVLVVVAGLLYRLRNTEDRTTFQRLVCGGTIWVVGTFSVLAVFYSDWALGMMTDNIAGLPSGDTAALYWTYWISKRLPMFSL